LNYRSAILFVRKAKTSCFVPRNITLYLVEQIGIRSSFFLMTIRAPVPSFGMRWMFFINILSEIVMNWIDWFACQHFHLLQSQNRYELD